ncbi:MAG: HAMP domain-containing histidine kinase [Bacteroidetes bacterium]|nr:HAMP domain-containing histidine kinase [Bacteroidota bacterium]
MKRRHALFYNISIFVLAQLAWLALLGIWIYWYVSNYIIFKTVGEKLSPEIIYDGTNIFPFVGGIILLVGIAFSMSLIFRNLNVQLKLNKLYDNFIANITHELKSPLSSIQLYLETLNSRNVPVEKQKEFIEMMMKDANRLKNLINSILEISALEQKKISHNFHVYDSNILVKELTEEATEQFKIPNSNVKIELGPECKCIADRNALKIVFDNLFDNAIKYSTKPVEIKVKSDCQSKKFILEISDEGIGIPSEEIKKIFNKFHRVYNGNIPNVKGTGLGLYWVREIIKSHGGKISASSAGDDKGTTFRIELPIYKSTNNHFAGSIKKNINKKDNDANLGE